MNQFTYKAAQKKCPSCGDLLWQVDGYLFCEREHGIFRPKWLGTVLPVATRTTRAGRFTIAGKTGFWKIPSHMYEELIHDGPEEGAVVASIVRYHSKIPTAVAFLRKKIHKASKAPYTGPSGGFYYDGQ